VPLEKDRKQHAALLRFSTGVKRKSTMDWNACLGEINFSMNIIIIITISTLPFEFWQAFANAL
jgi:hypothetical protein